MTRRLFLILWALVLVPAPALAQRPMSIVDLISVPVVSDPQLSPDGADRRLRAGRRGLGCEQAHQPPLESPYRRKRRRGAAHLRQGGRVATALVARRRVAGLRGEADGAERAQIHLLPMAGGEARRLTNHETAADNPAWSPDGRADLLPGARGQARRAGRRREGKRRCLCVRRGLPAAAPVEDGRGDRRRDPGDLRRFLGARPTSCRATARASRTTARPSPNFRRRRARRSLGDGRERRQRRGAHEERRAGERRPACRPTARAMLFISQANEAFETYYNGNLFVVPTAPAAGPRPDQGHRRRGDRRGLVRRRAEHLLRRQHGRAQLSSSPIPAEGGTPKLLTDGQARHRQLDLRSRTRPSRLHERRCQRRRHLDDDERRARSR